MAGSSGQLQLEKQIPVFLFNLSNIPNTENLVAAEVRMDDVATDNSDPEVQNNGASNDGSSFEDDFDITGNGNTEFKNMRNKFQNTDATWYVLAAVYQLQASDCQGNNSCRQVCNV